MYFIHSCQTYVGTRTLYLPQVHFIALYCVCVVTGQTVNLETAKPTETKVVAGDFPFLVCKGHYCEVTNALSSI